VERCLRHPLSSGLLLALNRHFKEPAEVRCSRWTSVFVRVIFYSDGEQVKTGVYDTFVFHGTVEQPFCPPRLLAASTLSSRPPQHHHCHKGRDKQNRRAPPLWLRARTAALGPDFTRRVVWFGDLWWYDSRECEASPPRAECRTTCIL